MVCLSLRAWGPPGRGAGRVPRSPVTKLLLCGRRPNGRKQQRAFALPVFPWVQFMDPSSFHGSEGHRCTGGKDGLPLGKAPPAAHTSRLGEWLAQPPPSRGRGRHASR